MSDTGQVPRFPMQRETVFSPAFLDTFRENLRAWSIGLHDPATGGFRHSDAIGVNVMSSTDMVWIRYALRDPDPGAPDRDRLVAYLQGEQDPETGMVYHDRGPAGQGHCDGHAFWHTARALGILGAQLRHFPHHLKPLVTPAGLEAWFDSIEWDAEHGPKHHEVLGLIPLLVNLHDAEWTDVFYRKIGEQQDPATGAWPRVETNISRTYAYTVLHIAGGRMPAYPDRIVDTILDLQEPNGLWDTAVPQFHTMDSAYLLARLPSAIGHRQEHARDALWRLGDAARNAFLENQPYYTGNPHKMLSLTHTFGLLQEVFPGEFPSDTPYRFEWEDTSVYRCGVIAGG
ncbi:MAG: hypothetical protein GY851_14910 [bacterium]|nr:hypothetical protein [bacterium]